VIDAAYHLEAFLMEPPRGPEAERWVKHAQKTLDEMKGAEPPPSSQKLKTSEYPGILE
jgi:hypothetical protein